jgi:O-antigen/teichoic acid export membrane protein
MALRSNLAAGFAASACIALAGLAFIPVYIRYLGPDGWGAVGFFITLQGWLSIVDNGLSPSFNREFARVRAGARSETDVADLLRSAEWLYAGLGLATVLAIAACSHWFANSWLHAGSISAGNVQVALQWLGIAIAAQWLASLYRQALLGLQRQVMPHMAGATAAIARGVVTLIAFESIAPTLPVFVGAQLAIAGAETIILRIYLHRCLPALAAGRWSRAMLGELRGFAAGLTGISLLAIVLTQGGQQ